MSLAQASESKRLKQIIHDGTKLFNESSKKGIAFLQEKEFLATPFDAGQVGLRHCRHQSSRVLLQLSKFFRSNAKLSKTKLGEFLGAAANIGILEAYIKSFDFSDKPIDDALRAFLSTFRLPGEAQIISRIVELLAEHWHNTFTGVHVVEDRDAAFILLYAIILLNVDQHNPKNKRPMTLNDFVKNQARNAERHVHTDTIAARPEQQERLSARFSRDHLQGDQDKRDRHARGARR